MKVLICNAQVPFARGGAEILVDSLAAELRRRGVEVDLVRLPFNWVGRGELLKSALAWRLLDVERVAGERIDAVIATRFPSYLIRHPNKVVWLVHQHRQVYELLGTEHSDFTSSPRDQRVVEMVRAMDRRGLSEARAVCTISRNTAQRLKRFNGLEGTALYPPPALLGRLRRGAMGDYVFASGRLEPIKRFDLLLEALARTRSSLRCRIAGEGPELERLRALARRLGIADRVELLGWVDEERLLELYAGCLAVYYAPFDEDYGYVTVEAFLCGKPVVTTADAGGVLEFVEDGRSGCVAESPDAARVAVALDRLHGEPGRAARLGADGRARVAGIGWDKVVAALLGDLAPPAA